jgi:methylated-DNA-[protein]-cysteine S-methyltransferase
MLRLWNLLEPAMTSLNHLPKRISPSNRVLRSLCTGHTAVLTPLGQVMLARTEQGLAGLWFEGQKHHPEPWKTPAQAQDPLLQRTVQKLLAYFNGDSVLFDLPLDLRGTPFQRAVWQALLLIPAGQTRSYSQIAQALGAPSAIRAVGAAVGRNPVSIIVPCHRVVGSTGALTGYAGGLARKQALLALEVGAELRVQPPQAAA